MIFVVLNRNIVILYEIQFNLNYVYITLHVLLHVIIFAIYIQRMNDSRYNTHFNIWYDEKFPIMLDSVTFLNMYKISSYLQSLFARVN